MVAVVAEEVLDRLIRPLRLTVRLRMEGGGEVGLDLEDGEDIPPELPFERHAAIADDMSGEPCSLQTLVMNC